MPTKDKNTNTKQICLAFVGCGHAHHSRKYQDQLYNETMLL